MGEDDEKYQVYLEERRRSLEWEYSETWHSENRQFCLCVAILLASAVIIFSYGDASCLGILSLAFSAFSLIALQCSSMCSQIAFRFYRESLIGPDMELDEAKRQEYDRMTKTVSHANILSYGLCVSSITFLVLRCAEQVAS